MTSRPGFGITPVPTERLVHVARLAWRTLPYAFARTAAIRRARWRSSSSARAAAAWDFGTDAGAPPRSAARASTCASSHRAGWLRKNRADG